MTYIFSSRLPFSGYMYSEDGGNIFLRNGGMYLLFHKAVQSRRPMSTTFRQEAKYYKRFARLNQGNEMDGTRSAGVEENEFTHSLEENIGTKMDISLYKYESNGTGKDRSHQ
jgi:hypothetical protein